jgi:hypothetical protein
MIVRAFNKLNTTLIKRAFNKKAAKIRTTAPVSEFDSSSNLIVLSMVQKKDADMYLIALKSFLKYLRPQKVVIVADPSIDEDTTALFHRHIDKLEVVRAEKFRFEGTPQGGCWERLNAISHYAQQHFVVQLDADTITLSEPSEVIQKIRKNCSFTLGTLQGQNITTLAESANFAREHKFETHNHIQVEAESVLDCLDLPFQYYVRGCAGFAGFAPGSITQKIIEEASQIFHGEFKDRWIEWGSEQFMSNLIVANSEKITVLPISRYLTPESSHFQGLAFLHLIGEMRFSNSIYLDALNHYFKSQ